MLEDLVGALDGDFDHTDPKNFLEIQSQTSLKGGATYVTNARKEKVDNYNGLLGGTTSDTMHNLKAIDQIELEHLGIRESLGESSKANELLIK